MDILLRVYYVTYYQMIIYKSPNNFDGAYIDCIFLAGPIIDLISARAVSLHNISAQHAFSDFIS